MKKLFTITLCLLFVTAGFAQKKIEVNEETEKINGGKYNCLTVMIYEADEKTIKKQWKKLMKDYKVDDVDKGSEVVADNVLIKKMGENTVDIFARVEERDGANKLIVAFNLGGAYLTSREHKDKFKVAEDIVYDFAVDISKEAIKEKLDDQEDMLKDLEKDQKKLEKDKEKLEDDIADWKEDIKKAEKEIKENEKEQEKKKAAISKQQEVVKKTEEKLKKVK